MVKVYDKNTYYTYNVYNFQKPRHVFTHKGLLKIFNTRTDYFATKNTLSSLWWQNFQTKSYFPSISNCRIGFVIEFEVYGFISSYLRAGHVSNNTATECKCTFALVQCTNSYVSDDDCEFRFRNSIFVVFDPHIPCSYNLRFICGRRWICWTSPHHCGKYYKYLCENLY